MPKFDPFAPLLDIEAHDYLLEEWDLARYLLREINSAIFDGDGEVDVPRLVLSYCGLLWIRRRVKGLRNINMAIAGVLGGIITVPVSTVLGILASGSSAVVSPFVAGGVAGLLLLITVVSTALVGYFAQKKLRNEARKLEKCCEVHLAKEFGGAEISKEKVKWIKKNLPRTDTFGGKWLVHDCQMRERLATKLLGVGTVDEAKELADEFENAAKKLTGNIDAGEYLKLRGVGLENFPGIKKKNMNDLMVSNLDNEPELTSGNSRGWRLRTGAGKMSTTTVGHDSRIGERRLGGALGEGRSRPGSASMFKASSLRGQGGSDGLAVPNPYHNKALLRDLGR